MYPLKHYIVLLFCIIAAGIQAQTLEKLPSSINSDKYHEFAPAVGFDHRIIFFTREAYPDYERTLIHGLEDASASMEDDDFDDFLSDVFKSLSGEEVEEPSSSSFNQDIWMAILEEGQIREVVHPGFPLNNALPNSVEAILEKPVRVVQPNEYYKIGGMGDGISWLEMDEDGFFQYPKPVLVANFYNRANHMSFSMTPDAKMIVFALERDDSKGSTDLYVSRLIRDRIYTEPEPLPAHINSDFQETTPFIEKDGNRIYFASDRDGSSNLSIFYVEKLPGRDGWSAPVKLESPVNSESNESHPYLDQESGFLYFASDRDGSFDIFRYGFGNSRMLDNSVSVQGTVVNEDGDPVSANVYYGSSNQLEGSNIYRTNNGEFSVPLDKESPMVFSAKNGLVSSETVKIDPSTVDGRVVKITLILEGIEELDESSEEGTPVAENEFSILPPKGESLILDKIYFEKSTDIIRSESTPMLKELETSLKSNPGINIVLIGYTDNQGRRDLLVELSIQRASAIKDHLVQNGIAAERIQVQGLGPDQPIASNKTETERALNRRVEIRVLD